MAVLKRGAEGAKVKRLQEQLSKLGFDLGSADGSFGPATERAVKAFQRSARLEDDGVVGSRTLAALGLAPDSNKAEPDGKKAEAGGNGKPVGAKEAAALSHVTVEIVAKMFPTTPRKNIERHLPFVLRALEEVGLTDDGMVLMALASIRAETEGFLPISEGRSKFNTSPGGHPFNLYDNRTDLGNKGRPDGDRFKGRGFIQLTGRSNYQEHGAAIGLGTGLIDNPDLANDPTIAARLLASFIKRKEQKIRKALAVGDLKGARRLVNGGSHGLDRFTDAFRIGQGLLARKKPAPV